MGKNLRFFGVLVVIVLSASALAADVHQQSKRVTPEIWSTLGFIENRGQVDEQARYYLREGLRTTWVTREGLTFQLRRPTGKSIESGSTNVPPKPLFEETTVSTNYVSPYGARVLEPLQKIDTSLSFLGPAGTVRTSSFERLRQREVWRGVDMDLYRIDGELEEEFALRPGSDPSAIRFSVQGSSGLSVSEDGSLVIATALDPLRLQAPFAYQTILGRRVEVPVSYKITGPAEYGFQVGRYDVEAPLIIDPTVTYATYLGGRHNDVPGGAVFDSSNNLYFTGFTASEDFPVSSGALQGTRKNLGSYSYDGFLAKFSPNNVLLHCTFLGGNGDDYVANIALDGSNNVYLAGQVNSVDWPVTADAFQPSFGGVFDVALAKLSPDLSTIVYATYLGGNGSGGDSGNEFAYLQVNAAGEIFLVGATGSLNFPTTAGVIQTSYGGGQLDAFVAKLTAQGSLALSSYFGGNGFDRFYFTTNTVRPDGRFFIVFRTDSTDLPFTGNSFDTTLAGSGDIYFAELDAAAATLRYSTLLGGNGADDPWQSYVDSNDALILVGTTSSSDFPATSGAYNQSFTGELMSFATKIRPDGSGPVFSTAIGRVSSQSGLIGNFFPGAVMDVRSDGRILVAAQATGSNYPTTPDAFQTSASAGADAVFSILSSDGASLLYSTYFGGNGTDGSNLAMFDPAGDVLLLGATDSTNFPITSNAFQSTYGGGFRFPDLYDVFVLRVAFPTPTPTPAATPTPGFEPAGAVSPVQGGNGGSVTLAIAGNGFTSQSKVALVRGSVRRLADLTSISDDGTIAVALMDLRELAAGAYDVEVSNGANGAALSSPSAFTVVEGGDAKLWLRTVGRPVVRNGVPARYFVNFGNSGEVDAYHVYMFVRFSANTDVKALYDVRAVPSAKTKSQFDRGNYPKVAIDPETGEKIIVLLIPSIPAGATQSLPIELTVAEQGKFKINASFGPIGFSSYADMDEILGMPAPETESMGASPVRSSPQSLYKCFQGSAEVITSTISVAKIFKVANEAAKFQKAAADALRLTERLTMQETFGELAKDIGKEAIDGFGKSKALDVTARGAGLVSMPVNLMELGGDVVLTALQLFPPTAVAATVVDFIIKVNKFVRAGGFKACEDLVDDIIDPEEGESKGSIDPNDKVGPQGAAQAHWVQGDRALQYVVNFQNLPTATLPAQTVTITDTLDASKLDLATFAFGQVGFGAKSAAAVAQDGAFVSTIDLRPDQNLKVKIEGRITSAGVVTWNFTTLDASTNLAPEDPTLGFLPPNGEGRVLFTIEPKAGLPNGTAVSNMARIVFDNNAPIDTPLWTNTLAAPTNQKIGSRPVRVALKKGGMSRPQKIVIKNPAKQGGEPILISGVRASAPFVVTSREGCSGKLLEPKKSCKVSVAYNPARAKKSKGALTVTSNAKGGQFTIALAGSGKPVSLLAKPRKLEFGNVATGSTSEARGLTLKNPSSVPVSIASVTAVSPEFTVSEDLCTGILAPRQSCKISLTYSPARAGGDKSMLEISTNAEQAPQRVPLAGKGR